MRPTQGIDWFRVGVRFFFGALFGAALGLRGWMQLLFSGGEGPRWIVLGALLGGLLGALSGLSSDD